MFIVVRINWSDQVKSRQANRQTIVKQLSRTLFTLSDNVLQSEKGPTKLNRDGQIVRQLLDNYYSSLVRNRRINISTVRNQFFLDQVIDGHHIIVCTIIW